MFKKKYIKYKSKYLKLKYLLNKKESNKNSNIEIELYEILDLPIAKPKKYNNSLLADIIWLNKRNLHFRTNKNLKLKKNNNIKLPHGLKISPIIDSFNNNDINVLKKMFKFFSKTDIIFKYNTNNTLFLKNNPKKNPSKIKYSINEVYNLVKDNNEFTEFITYYFNHALSNLNVDKNNTDLINKLKKKCKFSILQYKDNNVGLDCHVDNLDGGEGPIITIGIGSSFYYDIRPVFYSEKELNNLKSFRVKINSNQLVIMDGHMRYCWQHCIPYGYTRNLDKYTIKIMFPKFRNNNPKYNSFFKRDFSTSY